MQKRILVYGMTDNPGGIETYLMNQLHSLNRDKAIFDFVTDFPLLVYAEEAEALGSKIYKIPAKKQGVIAQWRALAKILKMHPEYQTVYFNILDAGAAITMVIPRLFGKTILTHSHNSNTDKPLLHAVCRPILNLLTDQRIACSKSAAKFMFGDRQAHIIPNAIEVSRYDFNPALRQKKRRELGLEKAFAVCFAGRLTRQKNPKGLIAIFDAVYQQEKNAVLLCAGDGEMREDVYAFAKQKACFSAIRFLGKRKDIGELLQAADVFLLPSLYEGLPIVAIEAQAAGLPCFLSDRITREAAVISKNVVFLKLQEPPNKWAQVMLSYKGFTRVSVKEQMIQAGYDRMNPGIEAKKLQHDFESE